MKVAAIFHLRLAGVVLIGSAVGALLVRDSWGGAGSQVSEAIVALLWAALSAAVMGLVGFRSLFRAMSCDAQQMLGVMMKGMGVRALILAASMVLVHLLRGDEWMRRTLTATVLIYLLVLGVEVITLNQALRAGVWQKLARETDAEGTRGTTPAAPGPAEPDRVAEREGTAGE